LREEDVRRSTARRNRANSTAADSVGRHYVNGRESEREESRRTYRAEQQRERYTSREDYEPEVRRERTYDETPRRQRSYQEPEPRRQRAYQESEERSVPVRAKNKMVEQPGRRKFDVLVFLVALAVLAGAFLPGLINRGRTTDAFLTPEEAQAAAAGTTPIITEIMASNKDGYTCLDGGCYDWIEIYNPTSGAINLGGYALSDKLTEPSKFVFPNMVLESGQYVLVFASGLDDALHKEELHAAFRLAASGETVVLSDPNSNVVDNCTYTSQVSDTSWARNLKDNTWAATTNYTPGYDNTEDGWAAYDATRYVENSPLIISEVMGTNNVTLADDFGEYEDWIEIYNSGSEPINIGGYGLSDDVASPRQWRFPDMTIQPGQYLVVFASGRNTSVAERTLHTSFKLNAMGETLVLSDNMGRILDKVTVGELAADTSYRVNGSGQWETATQPTPGSSNDDAGYVEFQKTMQAGNHSGIIISEVCSGNAEKVQSADGLYYDWIELYNTSGQTVSLAGYGLTDDTGWLGRWKFPEDASIPAGGYLLVYASALDKTEEQEYHTNFGLSGLGEPIVLSDAQGAVLDKCFTSSMPYYMSYGKAADGSYTYMTEPTPAKANAAGMPGFASQPGISAPAGIYAAAVNVEISVPEGATVYYTLDGSTPTTSSARYTGPLEISETKVLKAVAYQDGYLPSAAATATYVVGEEHTLPVVSLSLNDELIFGSSGIYTDYNSHTEVQAHIEYMLLDGTTPISQDLGLRIFGAYSRANDGKSFALMARSKYGDATFDYKFFSELPYTSYRSLILRNGASEWNISKIRDITLTSLASENTDLDVQRFTPCSVYINGKYWGVYFIMEKVNTKYLSQHYGISEESIDLLVGNGAELSGSKDDYKELIEYCKSHDLTVQENYDYVASQVDIDNYIDYVICEIITCNTDTGNIKYWRSSELDGKWRWILYDLDWAYWPSHLENDYIAKYFHPEGHGVGRMFNNSILRALIKNKDFKAKFFERFAHHLNVTYSAESVTGRVDEIYAMIEGDMDLDQERWGFSSWQKNVGRLKEFATKRRPYVLKQFKDYFGLSDSEMTELFGEGA